MEKYLGKYRNGSARCKNWDYTSKGSYFVTICTKFRSPDFGIIKEGRVHLNDVGRLIDNFWYQIPMHFPFVWLDDYIVMPDHIHGIVRIGGECDCNNVGGNNVVNNFGGRNVALQRSYNIHPNNIHPNSINQAKNCPRRLYNLNRPRIAYHRESPLMSAISPDKHSLATVIRSFKSACTKEIRQHNPDFNWQPRFHDRIIRNQYEFRAFQGYIRDNPKKWHPEPF